MKDVGDLLRKADPVARERGLSPDEINRMRRAIVSAVGRDSATAVWWPAPITVAPGGAVPVRPDRARRVRTPPFTLD